MRKRLVGSCAVAMLVLAGCSPLPEESEAGVPEPVVPDTSVEPAVDESEHRWVQDLWVYESISKIDPDGEMIDLTENILAHLDGIEGQEHDLPEGAVFVVFPDLEPTVVDHDGQIRSDVEIVAGVLSTPDAQGLAVLATPDADAQAPIGLNDLIELDLTFLEQLSPGDALVADIGFLQAFAGAAPAELDPVALLAHRLEEGQTQHYGTDEEVGVFRMQLGQAVAGSTRGQMPAKSDPAMDAWDDAFDGCKGDLKCVSDYFQTFGEGVSESMKLIECNLTPGCNDNPDSESEQQETLCVVGVKGGGCAEVRGDPHITTVDGRNLSMQAVGEFLGVRGEGLEVQLRTSPWKDSRTASILTAVTVQAEAPVVMVDIDEGGLRIRVDGQDAPMETGSTLELPDLTVQSFPAAVQVTTPTGEFVTIRRAGATHLGMTISVDENADVVGLLAGTGLPEEFDHEEFYERFVNSWRVTDSDSAFTYDAGVSNGDFTDLTFPDEAVTIDTLSSAERSRAQAVCEASGIVSPVILAECIFDYAVTGSVEFVHAAKVVDMIQRRADEAAGQEPGAEGHRHVSGWHQTASSFEVGEVVRVSCPAGGTIPRVWGGNGGIYTADSSICAAAVHQGGITVERGGSVTVERTAGRETYGSGTTKNGVATRDWDRPWEGSFIILSAIPN